MLASVLMDLLSVVDEVLLLRSRTRNSGLMCKFLGGRLPSSASRARNHIIQLDVPLCWDRQLRLAMRESLLFVGNVGGLGDVNGFPFVLDHLKSMCFVLCVYSVQCFCCTK